MTAAQRLTTQFERRACVDFCFLRNCDPEPMALVSDEAAIGRTPRESGRRPVLFIGALSQGSRER